MVDKIDKKQHMRPRKKGDEVFCYGRLGSIQSINRSKGGVVINVKIGGHSILLASSSQVQDVRPQ